MKNLKTFEGFFGNLFGKSEKKEDYWDDRDIEELEKFGFGNLWGTITNGEYTYNS